MSKISSKQKLFLILFGVCVGVFFLEITLRLGGGLFLVLQEHRNAKSIKQKGDYRIMCLGESTTAYGQENSYPSQLERILNKRNTGIRFSVINKGTPSIDTNGILEKLDDNLARYRPNMVVAMMGINDGGSTLPVAFVGDIKPYASSLTLAAKRFVKSFRVYKLVKLTYLHILNKLIEAGILRPGEKELIAHNSVRVNADDSSKWASEEQKKKWVYLVDFGRRLRDRGKFDKRLYMRAAEFFNAAIAVNPEIALGYFELGGCLYHLRLYDKAEAVLKKALQLSPKDNWIYGALALCYQARGMEDMAIEYFRKANKLRAEYYNPVTLYNYRALENVLSKKGITLVCAQYPLRNLEALEKMLEKRGNVIFVDNETTYKKAVKEEGYDEYFTDSFAGDFGHCTDKGNRLLAENIADAILKKLKK
ncbi:MAG: tetratricopeptide repeat protein [Candidatus Omnitrophica bacterium]|nr:tetratricopeptide repeat protein [Candidatus Omnitrophota bacterium]